jgi:DNA-binding response OmpR family regulator
METILIQESDEAILDIVSTALEMEGYHVCSLSDQHENALEMVRHHRPGLILLDCWLLNHSGQLGHWIKSHFPRLPLVAFSSDPRIAEDYRLLAFDDYLKKPFNLEELYAVVNKFIPSVRKRRHKAARLSC